MEARQSSELQLCSEFNGKPRRGFKKKSHLRWVFFRRALCILCGEWIGEKMVVTQ